jgi:hypothetical protein
LRIKMRNWWMVMPVFFEGGEMADHVVEDSDGGGLGLVPPGVDIG